MSTADETRYGKPPRRTRFRKRQSGNPAGRPPGRKKEPPYEAVLGQMVTVREAGIERRVTAAEAFLLYLTKLGLDGDSSAARHLSPMIEGARVRRREFSAQDPREIVLVVVRPGSVNAALGPLRMARKLDRYRRHSPDDAGAVGRREGAGPPRRPAPDVAGAANGSEGNPNPDESPLAGLVGGTPRGWPF